MQEIKTVRNNGWQKYWLDLIPMGFQCNAANNKKKSKGNIYAALSWISTIFIICSLERITFGWSVFMTKWSESILYGVAVYKK